MRRLLLFALMLVLAVPASASPAAGKVKPAAAGSFLDLPRVTSKNIDAARVTIWLPPGYAKARTRWPVIYMHDGQNVFFPKRSGYNKVWAADKAMLKLMAEGTTTGAIIVAIDHQPARARQYFPQKIYDALGADLRAEADRFLMGPIYSDNYLRFIVTELKPMIDKRYRTAKDRANTYVVGSSMGGLISLYAIAEYPDVFGGAACVSTHWPLALPDRVGPHQPRVRAVWETFLTERLGPPNGRRIWFDHGDQTLDQFYGPYQTEIDRKLISIGWQPQTDFETRSYVGAAHEENAWAARLPEIFAWLLAKAPE